MFKLLSTNYYKLFYWVTVADSVKDFLFTMGIIFGVLTGLSLIGNLWSSTAMASEISSGETQNRDYKQWEVWQKHWKRLFNWCLIPAILFIGGLMFTPSKKDCVLIVAGGAGVGFLTSDSSARALPADLTKYLHTALVEQTKDLSTDVKEKLGVATPKETLLNKATKMTKDELIEWLKTDTTVIK
jgi:hypothetical protein